MPTEVTIVISSTEGRSVNSADADMPPSPLSIDALGAPANTSGLGDTQSTGPAPTPLPREQLLLDSTTQDSAAPSPSLLEAPSSAVDDGAPSPLPLDELEPDEKRAEAAPKKKK